MKNGSDTTAEASRPDGPGDSAAGEPSTPRRGRYHLTERDGVAHIVCGSTPNIFLRVERGLEVTEEGRAEIGPQAVFLDGVFAGPPFYDNKLRHYALDHHQGCVRAFTLATCEQAAVMLLQGMPLGEGEWTLLVNEPDLDALLAAWILMNHVELLREDAALLWTSMPLVRVEGVIDAHGPDMAALCGLDDAAYQLQRERIDRLLEPERGLRAAGRWQAVDPVGYSKEQLAAIDALLFPESYLDELLEIEEAGRLSLNGHRLAVLCRSHQGIYAVESVLKDRYGKQLAIIVLDLGGGRFTLRRVDAFMDQDLTPLYAALNHKDLRARHSGETENQWGGSGDIGGSPRKTGSALGGEEVLQVVGQVYGKNGGGWLGRLVDRIRS